MTVKRLLLIAISLGFLTGFTFGPVLLQYTVTQGKTPQVSQVPTEEGMIDVLKSRFNVYKDLVNILVRKLDEESGILVGIGIGFSPDIDNGAYKVTITKVLKNKPAEKAGVRENDVIVSVNGKTIAPPKEYAKFFVGEVKDDGKPGRKVTLELIRDGKKVVVSMSTVILRGDRSADAKNLKMVIEKERAVLEANMEKALTAGKVDDAQRVFDECFKWFDVKEKEITNLLMVE